MRRGADELSSPLSLVYIAGNLVDAQNAERALTEHGIDYALSLEPFMKSSALGTVFGGTYAGVFFFVSSAQREFCCELLRSQGFADTIASEASMEKIDGA